MGDIIVKDWFELTLFEDNSFNLLNIDEKGQAIKSYNGLYNLISDELVLTVDNSFHLRGFGYNLFNSNDKQGIRIDWIISVMDNSVSAYPSKETIILNKRDTINHYEKDMQSVNYSNGFVGSICFPHYSSSVINIEQGEKYNYITLSLYVQKSTSYQEIPLRYPGKVKIDGINRRIKIEGLSDDLK